MKLRRVTAPLAAALSAGLALVAVPATSLAGLAPAQGAPGAPSATSTTATMSIGTYNIRAGETFATFKAGINEYLPQVDVAGLQEIAGLERTRWLRASQDWHVWMAPDLGQVPIVWNPQKFDFLGGGEAKLSDQARVEGGVKDPTYAAIVHLTQVASGQRVSVVNVHLIQGAVRLGAKDPTHPLTYRVYKDQVARLKQVVLDEQAAGYTVYVTGDFNVGFAADQKTQKPALPYATLSSIGLTAIWEGRKLQPSGTHIDHDCAPGVRQCGAYLDQIWSSAPATTARVLTGIVRSDHYPVRATYALPVPLGYLPTPGTIGFASIDQSFDEGSKPYQGRRPNCVDLTGLLTHGWARVQVTDGTATEGDDFTIDVQSWSDDDLSHNCVDVYIDPDQAHEPDQSFTLSLVDPVNTVVTLAETTVTIRDDD